MIGGIVFGGIIFWILVGIWLVVECGFLYARHSASLAVLMIGAVAGIVFVENVPEMNYWWLALYPVVCLIWLPIYWYLSLRKTASELKEAITDAGSVEKARARTNYTDRKIRPHIKEHYPNDIRTFEVDIQNPSSDQLVANTVLAPLSIPIFFAENLIEASIRTIRGTMNKIRKSLSDGINNKFNT